MAAVDPLSFGDLLKRYRVGAGLTQEALAERAHLSARAISDLERGAKLLPRYATITLLAEALQLSTQERATFAGTARPTSAAAVNGSLSEPRPHPDSAAPAFVGRTHELALLDRHLAGEGPAALVLAGEPGIGKSRLLQEAAQQAKERGWRVLSGGCQRRGGQEPYAPLLGALARYIADQAPVHLRADLQGCAWLVRLLPELTEGPIAPLPAWTLAPEQERRLMFAAVGRFLANVAGPAGTLLVLDDLQWAGADALDLLLSALRSVTAVPVRVVGAYRDTEVGAGDLLAVLLADLAQAGSVVHRRLAPLTEQEARQLLDRLLPEPGVADEQAALRERVLLRAGGAPFFLLSCAQALQVLDPGGGRTEAVPWDLAHGLRLRVAALPVAAQEMLGLAAVVGRRVPQRLLRSVSAYPEREVLAALRAACRAGLLDEEGADTYVFAHDVIREVVEADLGAAGRATLHRTVAEALERGPGEPSVELLAYHYERAGVVDKAVLYLERAGDRAHAHFANAAAEGHYRALVAHLERDSRVLDAAVTREKLGAVLATMGHFDATLEALEEAGRTYEALGEVERWGGVIGQIGNIHALRGTPDDGVARLEAAVESLEARGATPALAALYAALAHLYMVSARPRDQLAATERAVALARTTGDERVLPTALERQAEALWQIGRVEEARQTAEAAVQAAEVAGDLEILGWALDDLAKIHRTCGDLVTSWAYHERALPVAERQGNPVQIAAVQFHRAVTAFHQGHWAQARRDFEDSLALERQTDTVGTSWSWETPLWLTRLSFVEGDWDAVSRALAEHRAPAGRTHDAVTRLIVQSLLVEQELLDGQPAAAQARLLTLLHDGEWGERIKARLRVLLAWTHLEMEDLKAADQEVAAALACLRGDYGAYSAGATVVTVMDALRVQALVATAQGRWPAATMALEEGVARARKVPHPYAEARLLHAYGAMHACKGERAAARERLDAALAIFQWLGAARDCARTLHALADLAVPGA